MSARGNGRICIARFSGGIASFSNNPHIGAASPSDMISNTLTRVYSFGQVGGFSGGACFDTAGRSLTLNAANT